MPGPNSNDIYNMFTIVLYSLNMQVSTPNLIMVSCFSYIWLGAASESAFMAPTLERNHPTAEESKPQVELSMYYAIIVALSVKRIYVVLFPTSFA